MSDVVKIQMNKEDLAAEFFSKHSELFDSADELSKTDLDTFLKETPEITIMYIHNKVVNYIENKYPNLYFKEKIHRAVKELNPETILYGISAYLYIFESKEKFDEFALKDKNIDTNIGLMTDAHYQIKYVFPVKSEKLKKALINYFNKSIKLLHKNRTNEHRSSIPAFSRISNHYNAQKSLYKDNPAANQEVITENKGTDELDSKVESICNFLLNRLKGKGFISSNILVALDEILNDDSETIIVQLELV